MPKNTPKAPAESADAPTTDANATAPAPDTTEIENGNAAQLDTNTTDEGQGESTTEPTADGAAQPEATPPEVTDTPPPPLPKKIKLVTPYGFYDDADQLRMWQAGHETDDIDEVELLVTRGAEFEILE